MKTKFVITCFAFLFTISLSAQEQETLWGNRQYGFSGFWGGMDYNYSYFDDDEAYARGLTLAAEFGRQFLIGYTRQDFRGNLPKIGDANQKFDLGYNGLYLGYVPKSYKAIHPKLNVSLGRGRIEIDDTDRDNVYVIQPGAGIELNICTWFRIGAEAGYRFVTHNDLAGVRERDISSPYAQIGLRFGFSRDN